MTIMLNSFLVMDMLNAGGEVNITPRASPDRVLSEPSPSSSNPSHQLPHISSLPVNLNQQSSAIQNRRNTTPSVQGAAQPRFLHAPNLGVQYDQYGFQRQSPHTAPITPHTAPINRPTHNNVKYYTMQHPPNQQPHQQPFGNMAYQAYAQPLQQPPYDWQSQQQQQQQLYPQGATNKEMYQNAEQYPQNDDDDEPLTSVSQKSTAAHSLGTDPSPYLHTQSQEKVNNWLESNPGNTEIQQHQPLPHGPSGASSQYPSNQTQPPSQYHRSLDSDNLSGRHERSSDRPLQLILEVPRPRGFVDGGEEDDNTKDGSMHSDHYGPPVHNPEYRQQHIPPVPHASSSFTSTHVSGDSSYSQLSMPPYFSSSHQIQQQPSNYDDGRKNRANTPYNPAS